MHGTYRHAPVNNRPASTITSPPRERYPQCSAEPSGLWLVLERPCLDWRPAGEGGGLSQLERSVEILGSDDPDPAQLLLALHERAVGHEDFAAPGLRHGRHVGSVQPALRAAPR